MIIQTASTATFRGLVSTARNRSKWAWTGYKTITSLLRGWVGGYGTKLSFWRLKDGTVIFVGHTTHHWVGFYCDIEPLALEILIQRENVERLTR